MHTVIIGGSRGIGLELAKIYAAKGDRVTVTGRKKPEEFHDGISSAQLNLSEPTYKESIHEFVAKTGTVDRLVFSPGYYQEGTITDLDEEDIEDMIQVCGGSFIFIARSILLKQNVLKECIVITSSSQWTPRKLEPIYNFAKAGLAHFAHALSLDERVGKMLVVGPTGTKTTFHSGRDVDMSTYHESEWVAQQIFDHSLGDYTYKFIKILRNPTSIEVVERE